MSTTHRIHHQLSPRLVGAAVLFAGASMSVLAGPASADSSASAEGQPEKVFVCKYVGTPDVDERLQTGNNPIEVSVNAIPIYTGQPASDLIGQEFADAQGRSIVIAVSPVRGGGQGDEPTIEDCPAPDGPPVTPETPTTPTTPVTPETPTTPVTPETPTTPVTPETPTTPPTPETPTTPATPQAPEVQPETGTQTPQENPDVLGEQAFAPTNTPNQQPNQQPQAQPQSQQALPTAVNAGASPAGAPASGTDALLAMLLVMLGAVSARLGWIRVRG